MGKRITAATVGLKRAYEAPGAGDGIRILIDRLWPRGVTKANAAIDLWAKDIAPSTSLRRWFGHDPARWPEFRRRYSEEIHGTATGCANCAHSLKEAGSHSCLRRMMKPITTLSSCGTFFWVEKPRENPYSTSPHA